MHKAHFCWQDLIRIEWMFYHQNNTIQKLVISKFYGKVGYYIMVTLPSQTYVVS